MQSIIVLLLVAVVLSFITVGTLLSQLQKGDDSYIHKFSDQHLRRGVQFHPLEDVLDTPTPSEELTATPSVVSPTAVIEEVDGGIHVANVPRKPSHRVAMMVIYVGNALPSWFRTFALSVEGSGDLVKWLIFVTEATALADNFENIDIIHVSRRELYQRLTRLDPEQSTVELMDNLVTQAPYSLVEFKPCLATIFEEYIANYTHWGYADVDVLMGRTKPFLTDHMLSFYDVYTVSFGDNGRYYMRGQITIFKNNEVTNTLWKQCPDLLHIARRLKRFAEHPDPSRRMNGWHFESAEGCISKVVASQPGLRSISTSNLLSDAFRASTEEKETLMLSSTALRCYGMPLSQLPASDLAALLSDDWVYENPDADSGRSLTIDTKTNCAFWIPQNYQVCVTPPAGRSDDTIVQNGVVSASRDHYSLPAGTSTNSTCREAAMTHFQGWKKEYADFTTSQPPQDAHATVVTQTGLIYLRVDTPSELPNLHSSGARVKTYGEILQGRSWSGRVIPGDLHETGRAVVGPSGNFIPRLLGQKLMQVAGDPSILHLADKKKALVLHKQLEMRTDYCLQFKDNLAGCSCYLLGSQITVLRVDPTVVLNDDVTLVTVGWADEIASGAADQLLSSFGTARMNKIVVVAHKDGSPPTAGDFSSLPRATLISVDLSGCGGGEEDGLRVLPDKTLFNMGMDAAATDTVLLTPLYGLLRPLEGAAQEETGLLALVSQEVRANHGYAVVFEIDHNSVPCAVSELSGLRPAPHPGHKHRATIFDFDNQMVPIIFNMRQNSHGFRSARLPEELNGDGCYSSALFRVLAGHGYHMAHSRAAAVSYTYPELVPASTVPSRSCGCRALYSPTTDDALNSFQHKAFIHFERMRSIRKTGINDVYAREPLGRFYS